MFPVKTVTGATRQADADMGLNVAQLMTSYENAYNMKGSTQAQSGIIF